MDINEIINNLFNFQQNIYDSNFRYTVIALSRETQGPLLSLVCFINNEPYNWISVYFHAEVQAIFPLVFPRGYFLESIFLMWVELLPTTGNFNSFFKVHERVWHHSNSRVKAVNKKRFFNLPFSPMRLKIQENSVLPINCVFFVLENVLCNTIGFLLTSNCIFVLVSSRGGKMPSLTNVALVTGIATKTINHILPLIRMFRWFKLTDRVENGFSFLEKHTNIYVP